MEEIGMNAAVTGGTGFLGQVVVRMLLERGDSVRVLFRKPQDGEMMRSWGAEPVQGDVTLPNGCDGLVRPGDTVYHGAARVDMTGPWAEFARTTIEGTRVLLRACLPLKPRRFVYLSSAAVYLGKDVTPPVCVDRTPANPFPYNFYAVAKLEAENIIRAECEKAGVPWSIVRLGFLYGPNNRALFKHFVSMLKKNRMFIVGDGQNRIATLYVDDAARAVVLAGTHPAATGRIYDVASDERVTQQQYVDSTAEALGLPRPARHIGRGVARVGSGIMEFFANLTGRESQFTRAMVMLISADQEVDTTRIRNELGWRPEMSFKEGMRLTSEWRQQLPPGTLG
jgi:nucleoside-diphosphate-sugar epimerase